MWAWVYLTFYLFLFCDFQRLVSSVRYVGTISNWTKRFANFAASIYFTRTVSFRGWNYTILVRFAGKSKEKKRKKPEQEMQRIIPEVKNPTPEVVQVAPLAVG
jgi:hypothetical protein